MTSDEWGLEAGPTMVDFMVENIPYSLVEVMPYNLVGLIPRSQCLTLPTWYAEARQDALGARLPLTLDPSPRTTLLLLADIPPGRGIVLA